jgi:hypothetical protein
MKFQALNLKVEDYDTVLTYSKRWIEIPLKGVSLHLRHIHSIEPKTALMFTEQGEQISVPYNDELVSVLPLHSCWVGSILHEHGIGRKKITYNPYLAGIYEALLKAQAMQLYSTKAGVKLRVLDVPHERLLVVYLERNGTPDMRVNNMQFKPLQRMLDNILKCLI